MRMLLRSAPVLFASALLILAPTISPGGVITKGPFEIDPRSAEPDTDFTLSFSGESCAELIPDSSSSRSEPDFVLLTAATNVRVQVVGPRPSDTVVMATNVVPDVSGNWNGTLPLNLAEGTYLVTAECRHLAGASQGADSASSHSETTFILLGEETAMCTDDEPVGTPEPPFDTGPGCYEPQELVIETSEAGPAEERQEQPTFTG